MRIVFTDTGAAVLADWLGAERTVFEGTVFECVRWIKEHA